jgi:hypothetical protein
MAIRPFGKIPFPSALLTRKRQMITGVKIAQAFSVDNHFTGIDL